MVGKETKPLVMSSDGVAALCFKEMSCRACGKRLGWMYDSAGMDNEHPWVHLCGRYGVYTSAVMEVLESGSGYSYYGHQYDTLPRVRANDYTNINKAIANLLAGREEFTFCL